jgi:hypothetical protein
MIALLLKGLIYDQNVLFLYPEDTAKIQYAREMNEDSVAVVMYNPATAYNVWRLTDELLEYDKVFYMNEENLDEITEKEVVEASRIILYVADDQVKDEAINNLIDCCKMIVSKSYISSEDMWTTYEMSSN